MSSTDGVSNAAPVKPFNAIILDSSPLLLNTPPLSTLLSQSNELISTPNVISEIRDVEARRRVETTYLPFLTLRSPKPESVQFVRDFARRTGDLAVLSKTDIEVVALAYDLEIEKNGGDWRLRNVPGQKKVNGSPPVKEEITSAPAASEDSNAVRVELDNLTESISHPISEATDLRTTEISDNTNLAHAVESLQVSEGTPEADAQAPERESVESPELVEEEVSSSDSDGWITPSNIKKKQTRDEMTAESSKSVTKVLQAATITGDFAMQNVLLQINLNLLSPNTCKRISNVRTTVLRCHACFATTKEMNKQFCQRCGKPTLTRVTCTTNDRGEVKLHLKKNMQWNNKGNVFSVPKPTSGRSNQKWQGSRDGGGKSGWGNHLILAEDQKEYVRAMATQGRTKSKDLMDEDVLPSILTGDRQSNGGKIRIGGGRNVNSRKR